MLKLKPVTALLMLLAAMMSSAPAAFADDPRKPVKSVRTFFFGNSTIFHGNNTPETVVPYWINEFAKAGGNRFAFDGQFGFMQHHAEQPTIAQWGVPGVKGAWNSDTHKFGGANFDSIVITSANFIQSVSATEAFYGAPASVVEFTLKVIDDKHAEEPGVEFFIYENWPEMASFIADQAFPADAGEFAKFNDFTVGAFHDWWVEYNEALKDARPDVTIRLVPVGSMLSRLFTETGLSALTVEDLYVDEAPHGTGTLYFLAGIVTYTALYGQTPEAGYPVPDVVHPLVREQYPEILKVVAANM